MMENRAARDSRPFTERREMNGFIFSRPGSKRRLGRSLAALAVDDGRTGRKLPGHVPGMESDCFLYVNRKTHEQSWQQ